MNSLSSNPDRKNTGTTGRTARSIVPVLLILAVLGFAAIWFFRLPQRPGAAKVELSEHTKSVVAQLNAPMEFRFYSGLPDAEKPASVASFEEHARAILKAYVDVSKGQISVKDLPVTNNATASAASGEGIRPQNLDSDNPLYMGLILQQGDLAQVIPAISQEYSAALEPDITRALVRIIDARKTEAAIARSDAPDLNTFQQVSNTIPDVATISVEAGTKKLRESMLNDLAKAGGEFDTKMAEVRQALEKAEASGNAGEIALARKALTDAELSHSETLKQIIANSTAQIRALEQIKSQQK